MNIIEKYSLFVIEFITLLVFLMIFINFIVKIKKKINLNSGYLKIFSINKHYFNTKNKMMLFSINNRETDICKYDNNCNFLIKLKKIFEYFILKKIPELQFKKPVLYVLDFNGGINANEVRSLRQEITSVLSVATKKDKVLVCLESGGGTVSGYGLAASQLQRIRDAGISLIVSVDKIAASGGYLMACVANKIIAAPFAIIGSIGVVAQIPNFNKLLKKNNIDIELHTAGSNKRNLTLFGKNTEDDREKFCIELKVTHSLFKNFVSIMRPHMNIKDVSNGEYWFGTLALEKKLIDSIDTSDNFIISRINKYNIVKVQYIFSENLVDKFTFSITKILNSLFFSKIHQ
ncbi:protease SohB [Buchnera aphidicola (Kurisakia onigurumii)]|uniref:protease SohB n=1 Tax=Buchnera aphidicola TaxID=9 RepID=UPI0031B6F0E5